MIYKAVHTIPKIYPGGSNQALLYPDFETLPVIKVEKKENSNGVIIKRKSPDVFADILISSMILN